MCRKEGLLREEDQKAARHQREEYRQEEFPREECQRVACQKEEMGARWWCRHASGSQRRRSQSGECRKEECRREELLKEEDQRVPRRLAACPLVVCRREEFRREGCPKEEMGARWWHQRASRWQRRSEPGAFPRAVFRKAACPKEAIRTEELRREVGLAGQCRTEEVRMGCRREAGERWTRPLASRSRRRPWQLVAHQREGRPREEVQKALQQEECRKEVGQRTLQMEEVLREFRLGEGGGCSRLPS